MSLKVTYADAASSHLTAILLSTWGVFVYRDIWPLCTYDGTPTDIAEGPVLWTKVGLLTFSTIVVPLVTPRRYRPLDASVRISDPKRIPSLTRPSGSKPRCQSGAHCFNSLLGSLLVPRQIHLPGESSAPLAVRRVSTHRGLRQDQKLG